MEEIYWYNATNSTTSTLFILLIKPFETERVFLLIYLSIFILQNNLDFAIYFPLFTFEDHIKNNSTQPTKVS